MKYKTQSILFVALAALAFVACGDDDETSNNENNVNNVNNINNINNENNENNLNNAQTARLQVIHNAADPAAATVDVYANGELLLDDFEFRTASPFVDVAAGADIEVAVAPGTSDSVDDAIATFGPYNLEPDSQTVIVANGVLDDSGFEANPDGADIAFTLWPIAGQEAAADAAQFEFQVVHGATDAPTVDVSVQGADLTLVDDASYGDATGYIAVDPAAYVLDLTTADGETVVASYSLDASGFAGVAAVVVASGFLTPGDDDPDSNAFELVYYTAAGGAGTAIPVQ